MTAGNMAFQLLTSCIGVSREKPRTIGTRPWGTRRRPPLRQPGLARLAPPLFSLQKPKFLSQIRHFGTFYLIIAIYRQANAVWPCDFPHIRREGQPVRRPPFRNFVTPKVRPQEVDTQDRPCDFRELPHCGREPIIRLLNTFQFAPPKLNNPIEGF